MRTTGHHTCSNENGEEYIKQNAPFKSIKKHKNQGGGQKSYVPFLGEGYYYWDTDLEIAHSWGVNQYQNQYAIVESQLELPGEKEFCDLVGNRKHMIQILELANKFRPNELKSGKLTLGVFIQVLKKLNRTDYKGIFPYKAIRAVDLSHNPPKESRIKFAEHASQSYMSLSPKLVICLIEKNGIVLDVDIIHMS